MLMFYTALIDAPEEKSIFEKIYYRYRKQMLYVARKYLDDPHDAEDAVQNALLGIAKTIKTVPTHDARVTRAYVLTAAKNAALAVLSHKHRHRRQAALELAHLPAEDDTFEKVAAAADYELLLRCIQQLDPIYRDVLLMVYVYGHDYKDCAAILSRKPETVRKQLYRGRQLLMELCKKEGLL